MPNKTYELRNLYFQQSQYSVANSDSDDSLSLLSWPDKGYFHQLQPDADLLKQALTPISYTPVNDLAQQVFGQELHKQKLDLGHFANLFYERCSLHQKHIRDIQDRHISVQEKMYGVVINHFPDRSKRMGALETQLLQLEQQKREEELAFWKDTVELREKLFAGAATYSGARQRYSLFADVEDADGRKV